MTPDKTPSDAEILALLAEKKPMPSLVFLAKDDAKLADVRAAAVAIVRVGLAKWGSPVVAGEPVGYINRGIAPHTQGKVVFHEKPTENLEGRWWMPDQAVYATPQPTQAQAGAEQEEEPNNG